MKKLVCIIEILLLIFFAFGCADDEPTLYGPYEVAKVVDGDTIRVMIDGEETKVRMIGIDTPESVHPDKSKNTEEGEYASDRVKDLLEGESVYLEYDVSSEDQYGRMLAYVYLDDGETMIERILLSEGLASIMTVQPNSKYADEFYNIQKKAREEGKGFWGTGFFEEE